MVYLFISYLYSNTTGNIYLKSQISCLYMGYVHFFRIFKRMNITLPVGYLTDNETR